MTKKLTILAKRGFLLLLLVTALSFFSFSAHGTAKACFGCTYGTFNGSPACLIDGNLHLCEKNFPNSWFLYCIQRIDGYHPDYLTLDQVLSVEEITASNWNQNQLRNPNYTLTGIEFFTNLAALTCTNTQLKTVDLSKNTKLLYINLDSNQLTGLDVSNQPDLLYLSCQMNNLSALDLSANQKLKHLNLYSNQILSLDLSGNPALTEVTLTHQTYSLGVSLRPREDGSYFFDFSSVVGADHLQEVQNVTVESTSVPFDTTTGFVDYTVPGLYAYLYRQVSYTSTRLSDAPTLEIYLKITCPHKWPEDSCKMELYCSICGRRKIVRAQHTWIEGDCKTPAKCSKCGAIGDFSDHTWIDATCISPRTCSVCGLRDGVASWKHQWESYFGNYLKCRLCHRTKASGSSSIGSPPSDAKDDILFLSSIICAGYLAIAFHLIRKHRWHDAPVLHNHFYSNLDRDCYGFQGSIMALIFALRKKTHRVFTIYRKPTQRKEN